MLRPTIRRSRPAAAAILTWTPEQQAWGYRNMEKIAPVRVFKRGKTVHPLPLAAQIDPTFSSGDKTYNTESYMREFRASGVLVIKDGKIVLERYGLGRAPTDHCACRLDGGRHGAACRKSALWLFLVDHAGRL